VPTRKLRRPGHGEKLGLAWLVVLSVLYGPVSLLVRSRYRNLSKLPQQGGAIVVVNHVSHVDPLLLSKFFIDGGRRPRFLAKDSIFAVPVIGTAMRRMGHVPVKRGTADARQSFDTAVDLLENGGLIVMHPEGTVTRDPDGWPMAAKTGAARLALLAPDVPVIPVAQWGVQKQIDLYHKRIRLIPRPRHVMSVGDPIDLSAYRDRPIDAAALRDVTDLIMRRLRDEVAELRGEPAPSGPLFRWSRSAGADKAAG
jgi:1-acyl-sn-glycerol-3-phosphate acyltransferase